MKKIILSILSIVWLANAGALRAENIGVPAECEGVMLQTFYWNSYTLTKYGRTKWIDLLADINDINANFDLVWFPPSAGPTGGGVGYSAKQYSNQDSDWGTKTKLTELITALHNGKTKVLADVVINHRGNYTSWCNFWQDYFGSYGNWQLTSAHICKNDEVNSTSSAGSCKGAATGANDTGSNFEGARDLDHTNEYVQNWAKTYTQWLKSEMKYDGFRYDMTRGYGGMYLSMYNEASNPYLSVSEFWDGIDAQINHLKATNYNTMIFDFPMKYQLQGIPDGSYGKLRNPVNSLRGKGYAKYAVTFVDNHDTFERSDQQGAEFIKYNADLSNATNKNYILQANAYILMLPGVPCVFWPHWNKYRDEIKAMIAIRKQAGIHSESTVTNETTSQYNYTATIQGHKASVVLRLGKKRSTEVPEGYRLALEGGTTGDYTIFISEGQQGVETVNGKSMKGEKFMQDGRLYIRHGEHIYDITGTKIQ